MIISVEELKKYITTTEADEVLGGKLQALEAKIRKYTNNRFLQIPIQKIEAAVAGGVFVSDSVIPFKEGDTVQVTIGRDAKDCGVYTVKAVNGMSFEVNEDVPDMEAVSVLKVKYNADVKLGVAQMLKWEIEKGDKVGVQSETLSRYSVTYFNMDGANSTMGYPKALLDFLRPYKKARF